MSAIIVWPPTVQERLNDLPMKNGHARLAQGPMEANSATANITRHGSKRWQDNLFLGAGYHFHLGDVSLAVGNLTYQLSDKPIWEKVQMTGPVLGAAFRWYSARVSHADR
jgi:hypothetical protein